MDISSRDGFFRTSADDIEFGRGDIDGKCDSSIISSKHDRNRTTGSRCRTKKFCNGVKVPVFSQDFSDETSRHHSGRLQKGQRQSASHSYSNSPKEQMHMLIADNESTEFSEITSFCKCPICMDLLIEATAITCGHIFCASCLDTCIKAKPICPICSRLIGTCKIRIFNIDQIVDLMIRKWDKIPSELGLRHYDATMARMDKQAAERKSGPSLMESLRNKMDDLLKSIKCKGLWNVIKNALALPTNRIRQRLAYTSKNASIPSERNVYIYTGIGIVIGILATLSVTSLTSSTKFFKYMYLAIVQYDGTMGQFSVPGSTNGTLETDQNLDKGLFWSIRHALGYAQ